MDLIGEIVEHEVQTPSVPVALTTTGFPKLRKFDMKRKPRLLTKAEPQAKPELPPPVPKDSEADRIHKENMAKIASMTEEEVTREREELLRALDPKVIQSLLKRTEATESAHEHAEGFGEWIGGGKNGTHLPHLDDSDVNKALGIKSVLFAEDDEVAPYPLDHFRDSDDEGETKQKSANADAAEEDDEIAPAGYQIVDDETLAPVTEVHFMKPKAAKEDPDLNLDDPDFFSKLHEKYYPDLPKETSKLAWMTTPMPTRRVTTYEAISDMRFDFKGNLVELSDEAQDAPVHLGLHHHSDNPQMAGYTLAELLHLSRSVVPTQRCLGIQMLGRILHKLGLHKYNIMPIADEEDNEVLAQEKGKAMEQFETMMWDLIEQLRVIESITEASDETLTRNLSVRTYALEALWLWKQGGGRPANTKAPEDIIAEEVNQM